MRSRPSSSMQKTYDDCYLTCSTAVYFENQEQNNEAEALRSWRTALDQIYYHNAYKVPANYRPKSETEKALQESLRDMEMQCKERVDLLEALRQSRTDAETNGGGSSSGLNVPGPSGHARTPRESAGDTQGWLGQGTIPVVKYPDLSRPNAGPPLPQRPAVLSKKSSGQEVPRPSPRPYQAGGSSSRIPSSPPTLPVPKTHTSRSPSPEKKGLLTTLRNTRDPKRMSRSPRTSGNRMERPAVAAKAATQAWSALPRHEAERLGQSHPEAGSSTTVNSLYGDSSTLSPNDRVESQGRASAEYFRGPARDSVEMPNSSDFLSQGSTALNAGRPSSYPQSLSGFPPDSLGNQVETAATISDRGRPAGSPKPLPRVPVDYSATNQKNTAKSPLNLGVDAGKSRAEDSTNATNNVVGPGNRLRRSGAGGRPEPPPVRRRSPARRLRPETETPDLSSRPVANSSTPRSRRPQHLNGREMEPSNSEEDSLSSGKDLEDKPRRKPRKQREEPLSAEPGIDDLMGEDSDSPNLSASEKAWKERTEAMMKNLPKGCDESAAKQIMNEIVVHGDEVHWEDVAGLDVAKNALKEAVVYPFLRPDLFLGLREPARGMLLFGPPGTGKTMLARAVATESRSTFFSISASSLTSKYLGESEKLVRALFALARALAPSIIFVDEIDSLLSSRSGSGEHEATRRIKTEFLIQWSDLARAAAGRDPAPDRDKEKGDPTRVLVLAATNLPWAIDEAARRRFVRRQYIPLPEGPVRGTQLRTLLSHQKQSLNDADIARLIELTDSFSGSDITALAKDAAMGPLRSLGEALLHMSTDQIRPIGMQDFEKSLISIRPSVSSKGLQEFEDWAREFGERGG
ncbi:MAG: Fe(2+) transporter [Chaenotheca gracillima]|nr:MAG: Fe(2+) transporter [Chaenotheca gracillima]